MSVISRVLSSYCLLGLLFSSSSSSSSSALADPIVSPIGSSLDSKLQGPQSFADLVNSRAAFAVVAGGESARFRNALYSVNPFDTDDYDSKYYLKVVDDLVRIRTILENEASSRQSKISTNNTSGAVLDRQLSLLSEKIENERVAALLDRVELTKRQIVFLANQLKDDIDAALVYPTSSRKASSEPRPSAASSALKRAFTIKIGTLCAQVVKDCLALDSQYQVRLGSIISSGEGLKKQMTSTVGSNKVSDTGTTMYVRNYVNFGGVEQSPGSLKVPAVAPPAALLAVPGKLAVPTNLNRSRPRP